MNIDWEQVAQWCRAHCDGVAIASFLGIEPDTFYRRCKKDNGVGFSEFSSAKKAEGIMLVEASIYHDAISKGGADRIFWLKNKAGWKDKQEHEQSGTITNLNITVDSNETAVELKKLIGGS